MPDASELMRLTELLISRQDQQQQQLAALQAATDQHLADARASTQRQLDEWQDYFVQQLAEAGASTRQLSTSLAKTDEVLLTFSRMQMGLLDTLEEMRREQVRLGRRLESLGKQQGEFSQQTGQKLDDFIWRQEEFRVLFLEEIQALRRALPSAAAGPPTSDGPDQQLQNLPGGPLHQPV